MIKYGIDELNEEQVLELFFHKIISITDIISGFVDEVLEERGERNQSW